MSSNSPTEPAPAARRPLWRVLLTRAAFVCAVLLTLVVAFFLVERYCFFAEVSGQVQITRVYHHPWILDESLVLDCESSLMTAAGLRDPAEPPLAHFSTGVNVQTWAPTNV